MILCVNETLLKKSNKIQRDSETYEKVIQNFKYYKDVELAKKDGYAPINFMTSIRSVYSNLVLEMPSDDKRLYYSNLILEDVLPHIEMDLVMYLGSVSVLKHVNYTSELDKIMIKSKFEPIGIYYDGVLDPIIYSHVFITDDSVEDFKKCIKDSSKFVHISDMKRENNISTILDTLLIVEGKDNAK